jgi:tetratricopeptide (TPR) repeat protein
MSVKIYSGKMSHFAIRGILVLLVGILFSYSLRAQDYHPLMDQGDYKNALKGILAKIDEIYSKRVDDKRIPTDFITLASERQMMDINRLFRERKVDLFFIEDNTELYNLHSDAAKCFYETRVYDEAINHYYQALRFRIMKYDGEDRIFYGIAQTDKKRGSEQGYLDALETAASINERNMDYAIELGKALYRTTEKKRAIFHLERYVKGKGEELKETEVLIMLAGLNEDIHKYLETEKYYRIYLEKKPQDGFIHFALGYTAFNNTGNYQLADKELKKAIELLPENEIFKKSKSFEMIGDMFFNMLKYDKAVSAYLETVKYQELVQKEIEKNNAEIAQLDGEIRRIKAALIKEKNYVQYNEYKLQLQDREKVITERRDKRYEYGKMNPGKTRWNLAECYEKKEMLDNAITYYRQAIGFNYRSNDAREKIVKIQLKIKRGY